MWALSTLLLAFCACGFAQITDIDQFEWIKARYEDMEPTPVKWLEVKEVQKLGVVASELFDMFTRGEDNEDIYLGFSYNWDWITHNFESYLLKWDSEHEQFEEVGAQPRPTNNGLQEAYTDISYFNTADGETWAYHAFHHLDDPTERNNQPIAIRGLSYLYKFNAETDNFEDQPSYSQWSLDASFKTKYFTTPDNREFLWTASLAQPYTTKGTPNCTILEYTGSNWAPANNKTFNCTKFPLPPLTFENVKGQWLYVDSSFATGSFNTGGSLVGSINTANVGQRFLTYINNGFWDADAMGLAVSNLNTLFHFESEGFDYIIAQTSTGFGTWRLRWETHAPEPIPFVTTTQSPKDIVLFEAYGHQCLAVAYGGYSGYTESSPSYYENYFPIYCWDPSRDRWGLVLKVPARVGPVKFHTFMDGDQLYLAALQNIDHRQQHTLTVYSISEWIDDDETLFTREGELDAYKQYLMAKGTSETLDDFHHYKNMIIAILIVVALTFLFQLLMLLKGLSGGGGGSDAYTSFS